MKQRFRLYRRKTGGKFYVHDGLTGKQESLGTSDRTEAQRLLHTRNEAERQPAMNLQIARAYPPPDGWRVVPGSSQLVVDWKDGDSRGDWRVDFIHDTPAPAYHVETDHHGFGTSGKLKFHIEFDVTRTVQKEVWDPKEVNLTWGSSATFAAGGNAWKVSFDTFDGEHQEYTGPANHRYLNVVPEGTNVRISVPAAYQVKMYRL